MAKVPQTVLYIGPEKPRGEWLISPFTIYTPLQLNLKFQNTVSWFEPFIPSLYFIWMALFISFL